MSGVNVTANALRSIIRKEVPFIPGAYVDFYDSITVQDVRSAESLQANPNIDDSIALIISQVADWNFMDGDSPLAITKESFSLFTTTLLQWFTTAQGEVLKGEENKKKELPSN